MHRLLFLLLDRIGKLPVIEEGMSYGCLIKNWKTATSYSLEESGPLDLRKKNERDMYLYSDSLNRDLFITNVTGVNEHETASKLPATFAARGSITYERAGERPVCNQCGKVFVSLRSLSVHVIEHMNAVDCSVGHKQLGDCPPSKESDSFSDDTLGRIYDRTHEQRTTSVAASNLHVTIDNNKSDAPLLERGKTNRNHKLLGGLSLPCPVCGKTFVAMRNLESHLKSHTKQRPYQCMDCGKTFSLRNTLICHTRVHTKERPYTCTLCFKSFTQASTLKSHVIYKHTKQFPHKCDSCGRGFISPGQKMEHVTRLHGPGTNNHQ
ncbi:uncharacterized protein LOC143256214 [Tachypleus tridentatus]|uniref:uncharacterized protein LOC143256214 n=1 Tax=Tachypleus tridentatus TaxID=6853 RepID=UPI003FD07AC8